ncbi:hypothetical protein BLNAU_19862 [Blattamonas nauphoetae]|uniref:Uncharacterized protein n=1 Tax=Blattamonas nauphoetae TaxID=2049346 RepID=A0ABQ9X2R2_9EUKA|nr:hypothetical protein BLNAU_19862 [Blattamonas nauphoetae]
MLLFITSSDTAIRDKAASILHSMTSVPTSECIPTLCNVDAVALLADIDLPGRFSSGSPQLKHTSASTLLGHLSALFADADVSSPCVRTVKLLLRLASSFLTSDEIFISVGNCLPLTLLVTALTAAPPSHHVHILTMSLEFIAKSTVTFEIQEPFMNCLFSVISPDIRLDDPLLVTLLTFLTHMISQYLLWEPLVVCLSRSERSSTIALSLLTIINTDQKMKPTYPVHPQLVPGIAQLLLQDLDELSMSFLLSLLGHNADRTDYFRFEANETHKIVEKLLEIEQRHPLHTDTQETEKTTTDGTTLSPHVDRKGEAGASAGADACVNELVDVWRVMRMVMSWLAGSPSGLERLHVLYPLIFQRLKERGNTLLREGRQAEPKKDELLLALVRVCSELTPLLRTVDCFPLVHLVSSFLHLMSRPTSQHQPIPIGYCQSYDLDSVQLPELYVRMKEFFLRVDKVTQGLDGYDITHHAIFPPSSTEHSSAGANCVISRPIPLLEFFVDFEVKCVGVPKTALLQENNTTATDKTRRQLLLLLLGKIERTNDFDPSAVCGVLRSFPRIPSGTSQLIYSLEDVIVITRFHPHTHC